MAIQSLLREKAYGRQRVPLSKQKTWEKTRTQAKFTVFFPLLGRQFAARLLIYLNHDVLNNIFSVMGRLVAVAWDEDATCPQL